jgi:hypothetical protein
MEKDMAEDGRLWRFGMDSRRLAV